MKETTLPRNLPLREQDQTALLTMLVYSLPSIEKLSLQSFAALPGLGEVERVGEVLSIWEDYDGITPYCFIAGHNMREKTAYSLSIPDLQKKFGHGKVEGLFVQLHAENTIEQAMWLADRIAEHNIQSMGILLPAYHMLRAWRTVIREVVFKRDIWTPIFPLPLTSNPFDIIPEFEPEERIAKWQMIPGELERIRRYEAKGDIATFAETLQFIEWLWSKPLRA